MAKADRMLSMPPPSAPVDTTRHRFLAGAGSLFDDLNRELYDFAVGRLSEMLDDP